jgi:predicted DNA-binding WGR domain protein
MMIVMFKKDSKNRLHYYTMHDRQLNLLAQYALTAVWSTDEGEGREKVRYFESRLKMDRKVRELFGAKARKGYRILYRFDRRIVAEPLAETFSEAIL